jgi:hypothetical protein
MLNHRARTVTTVVLLISLTGCSSSTVSVDSDANYEWVFATMPPPRPEIVRSRVERASRCCWLEPYNGNWEFELYASPSWVQTVRADCERIEWSEVWHREVPDWFTPTESEYAVWRLQRTSYPNAHLFVEREPSDSSRVHVYIRRH